MSQFEYPKLRNVELIPVKIGEKRGIALRDPLRYTDEVIFLPEEAMAVVRLFDGARTTRDIQYELNRQYGTLLNSDSIENIARDLDDHLFLYSERFFKEKRRVEEHFANSDVRPAIHAGLAYSEAPNDLIAELDSYFKSAAGKKRSGGDDYSGVTPRGIIAPHISINAGGTCFAGAYRVISDSPPADLYVILGVGHSEIDYLFAGTKKHFETPLGMVKTDRATMEEINRLFGGWLFFGEPNHRIEHTIEFQSVFLKYSLRESNFSILPILASFPHQAFSIKELDSMKTTIELFVSSLKRTLDAHPGKVTIIASVDFAHVGLRYGDQDEPDSSTLERVKMRDLEMMDIISEGDAEKFMSHIVEDDNGRHVCGYGSIYTMLRVLSDCRGIILDYDTTVMDQMNSTVTFASMALY